MKSGAGGKGVGRKTLRKGRLGGREEGRNKGGNEEKDGKEGRR